MSNTKIMVIGRNQEILDVVLRLINQNEKWEGVGFLKDDDAIAACQQESFDLVLLGGGIEKEEEMALRESLLALNPKQKIIQHWGGGSGLLSNEIIATLGNS